MNNRSRRNFIVKGATAAAAFTCGIHRVAIAGPAFNSALPAQSTDRPIHVFTKVLQFLDYDDMAHFLAENGSAGADLTVREGGQVLPAQVEKDLPRAVSALRQAGVNCSMITTGIIDADDPYTRNILRTMAELGIKYYRTGYLDYDHSRSIEANLDDHKRIFEKLEKVNREYGVHGGYQNHSGRRVGAPVWDLYPLLKDRDPGFLGVQYDIRHATAEGAMSWPLGMRLLAPWIRTIDIKDFIWEKNDRGEWKIKSVPLGEGIVDFNEFFDLYKSFGIKGPVSIHYEYDLGGAEHGRLDPVIPAGQIATHIKKDIDFLKGLFRRYGFE